MPKLANWIEENVLDSMTVFDFPAKHRRRLRTTNILERLNKEINRRTCVARISPNEVPREILVGAILMEQDEDWQNQYHYLDMEFLKTNP